MLYIVGTPIGNLDDLSVRQSKTITQADIILTEDTRSTGILLQKIKELFNLAPSSNQRLISYYKEKEFEKLPEILELLRSNKDIVLISQAGLPIISDPGLLLLQNVIKEKLPFTVIPGPTSSSIALLYSGFNPEFSVFAGFLPKKNSHKNKIFKQFIKIKEIWPEATLVCFDSPLRLLETFQLLNEVYPSGQVVITRELTKKFEEVIRGSPKQLLTKTFKGEVTLVIH